MPIFTGDNVSGADRNVGTLFERLRLGEDRPNESEQSNESTSQSVLISRETRKAILMNLMTHLTCQIQISLHWWDISVEETKKMRQW